MALVIVGHPVAGWSGYERVAGRGLFFAAGFTEHVDLTAAQQAAVVASGYTVDGLPDPPVPDPFPQYLTEQEGDARYLTEAAAKGAFETWADDLDVSGTPDATSSVAGRVRLAGDLGGTADAPTVPGLGSKVNASTYTAGLAAKQDKATGMTVVEAGTNLSTARPTGVGAVYWKFAAGVNVGTGGANVTNRQNGDLVYVAS